MNYVRVCVCFVSHKKLKPAGNNNKTAKDEQLGQTSQFSFNSSSLGYVRLLHGLTLYIFRQGLLHLNSAEGLFGYTMVCR